MKKKWPLFLPAIVFVAGLLPRLEALRAPKPPVFTGDQAVFALMAKHIYELKEFPVYAWLAHYAGAFSSYLAAVYFSLFGISTETFLLAGITLSSLLVLLVYRLAENIFDAGTGLLAAALLAFPPFHVLYLSRETVGVYSEGLFFTALALLLSLRLSAGVAASPLFFLTGAVLGLGLWTSPFLIPACLAIAVFSLLRRSPGFDRKKLLLAAAGFLTGYLPAILYNIHNPSAAAFRMAGRILDADRAVLLLPKQELVLLVVGKIVDKIAGAPEMIFNATRLFLRVLGMESPFTQGASGIAGLAVLFVYAAALAYAACSLKGMLKRIKARDLSPADLPWVYTACFLAFYSLFAEPGRPRYLVPLILPGSLFLARFLKDAWTRSPVLAVPLAALVIGYNFHTCAVSFNSPGKDYAALAGFLAEKKIFYGYSDYWTAYPVVFESKEKILISPTAFNALYDRRPEYTRKVRNADRAAYVFDTGGFKDIEMEFQQKAGKHGITFKKYRIKEFAVYELGNVFPEKLALYELP